MAIKIPARSYLTFSELKERWQCTENDLRYAVISGEIKPCVRLVGEHENIQWVKAYAGTCERKSTHDGSFILSHEPKGWVYLQEPCQTGPFDCRFDLAAHLQQHAGVPEPSQHRLLMATPDQREVDLGAPMFGERGVTALWWAQGLEVTS